MAFTQVTITETFTRADGSAAEGTVTATLSEPIQNGGAMIEPAPIVGTLNVQGQLVAQDLAPFTLAAVDDTGTLPTGATYTFLVEVDSAPVREFTAVLSHLVAGQTVTLAALEDAPLIP